jgi:hypothetical protein
MKRWWLRQPRAARIVICFAAFMALFMILVILALDEHWLLAVPVIVLMTVVWAGAVTPDGAAERDLVDLKRRWNVR